MKRQPAASSASTTITTALTAAITTKNNNRRNNNAQPHLQSVDQTICQASRSARGSQNICTKTIGKCLARGFVYWLSYCSVGRGVGEWKAWRVRQLEATVGWEHFCMQHNLNKCKKAINVNSINAKNANKMHIYKA